MKQTSTAKITAQGTAVNGKITDVTANTVADAIAVLCAVILISFTVISAFGMRSDFGIYENILRLHIIANSDSEEDRALKLKVRDAVLIASGDIFGNCSSAEEAAAEAEAHRAELVSAAEKVISESGNNYGVTFSLGREYYPTRDYDGVSLPCGYYTSLRVIIGEGKGHNWWCILFPALCTKLAVAHPATDGETQNENQNESKAAEVIAECDATPCDTDYNVPKGEFRSAGFTENQISLLTEKENPKYVLRFRILEILGNFARSFSR